MDPDYTNPDIPLLGWPVEPGWRQNTPRHPKSYSRNWELSDGFKWFKIRHDPQDDPEIEAARQEVSDREFEMWMAMIFCGFLLPIILMSVPSYLHALI